MSTINNNFYIYKYKQDINYPDEYILSKNIIDDRNYQLIESTNKVEYTLAIYNISKNINLFYYNYNDIYYDCLFLGVLIKNLELTNEQISNINERELRFYLYVLYNIHNEEVENNEDYYYEIYNKIINKNIYLVKKNRLNVINDYIKTKKTFQDYLLINYLLNNNDNNRLTKYLFSVDSSELRSLLIDILDDIEDSNDIKSIYINIFDNGLGIWQQ